MSDRADDDVWAVNGIGMRSSDARQATAVISAAKQSPTPTRASPIAPEAIEAWHEPAFDPAYRKALAAFAARRPRKAEHQSTESSRPLSGTPVERSNAYDGRLADWRLLAGSWLWAKALGGAFDDATVSRILAAIIRSVAVGLSSGSR